MEEHNNEDNIIIRHESYRSNQTDDITDFDKTIHGMHEYIMSSPSSLVYQSTFSNEESEKLDKIRNSAIKKRRFRKWYKMSYTADKLKAMKSLPNKEIIKTLKKRKTSMNINLDSSYLSKYSFVQSCQSEGNQIRISQSEKGLKNYYMKKKKHFKLRVMKGPPDAFRKFGWFTCANIPFERKSLYYYHILRYKLPENLEAQINKDIIRTIEEQDTHLPELQEPLYRLLKAIALLDPSLGYTQGMNFILGYLLILMQGNEIEAFYMSISLFSHTFSNQYGFRGFFLENFPLLNLYLFIFDYHFKRKMNKLHTKIKEVELPPYCWVGKWFQTIFVNMFPDHMIIRIWDGILAYGIKFMISIALSIVYHIEDQLLKLEDLVDLIEFFKVINHQRSKNSNIKNTIHFDIEEIILKAKDKFYISKKEMKKLIELYLKENSNNTEKEFLDVIEVYSDNKVFYDYKSFAENQQPMQIRDDEKIFDLDTIDNLLVSTNDVIYLMKNNHNHLSHYSIEGHMCTEEHTPDSGSLYPKENIPS